jgi:uncharacterized protein YggU (UPF0235/DUF167 family)
MAGAGAEALAVRVTPRSSRNQVLGLPRRTVTLVRGDTSRSKWIAVEGLSAADLQQRLLSGV